MTVYACESEIFAGYSAVVDDGGQVTFTLPQGDYRFRADFDPSPKLGAYKNSASIIPTMRLTA